MASSVYPLHFEQAICPACYLPECCEFAYNGKANTCPLRISKRLRLTAEQGKALSEIAQHWGYQPRHFIRMAEQQAERNLIQVGGVCSSL